MNTSNAQQQTPGSDHQGEKKFKTMNLGDIKKEKPTMADTQAFTPAFPDFSAMNQGMMPFPMMMFNQMLSGAMQFPGNFQFPFVMGQQSMPPVKHSQSHARNKYLNIPMISLNDYQEMKAVKEKFESLRDLHDPKFRPENIKDADFFIIRSSNDDDFHKAIKYGIWSSSQKNNHALNEAYLSGQRRDSKRPVYLFFTVVNSDQYIGVAQMVSEVDFSKSFSFWWEQTKWSGVMNLKWVYIKDINYQNFSNIFYMNKQVTHHRDGTKLDFETGMKMLKVFDQSKSQDSIFDDFHTMDNREEKLRIERGLMDSVAEPAKGAGYQGHYKDSHRHYRDRGDRNDRNSDRDGHYYRKPKYSGEYQPKKKDSFKGKDSYYYQEREDKSEERHPGIVIQKKSTKSKKVKQSKEYKRKEEKPVEKIETGTENTQDKTADQKDAQNLNVDVPLSDS
jgi:hypothetical protein